MFLFLFYCPLRYILSFFNPFVNTDLVQHHEINRAKDYKCLNRQGGDLRDFEGDKEVASIVVTVDTNRYRLSYHNLFRYISYTIYSVTVP